MGAGTEAGAALVASELGKQRRGRQCLVARDHQSWEQEAVAEEEEEVAEWDRRECPAFGLAVVAAAGEEEPFGEALAEYSMDLVEFGLFATGARCCTPAG